MRKLTLRDKILIAFLGLTITFLAISTLWSSYSQQNQAEVEMHEKALVLAAQLDAVWEFMDINQERINSDSDGSYNFKGLHCSVVGKSIAELFNDSSEYITRYTNITPRNEADTSDDFETEAIYAFLADDTLTEYTAITEYEGEQVYRFVAPMLIEYSCLECHGEPAGELDILGYEKEGMEIGDLVGVMSIIMPIDTYLEDIRSNIVYEVAVLFFLIIMVVFIIYYIINRLVTRPLKKLETAVKEMENGNLDIRIDDIEETEEFRELAINFENMARKVATLYNDLETKVEVRTEQLNLANNQLVNINKRLEQEIQYKSDFLAIVSHELRTPLTSIIAFTDIWERTRKMNDKDEENVVTEIKNNSEVLLNMINNVLDMARIEAGKTEINHEPVDIADLIYFVCDAIRPQVTAKGIKLETQVARDVPLTWGDWEKLRRIIENLASNAVKFTPKGGEIWITANCLLEAGTVEIEVSDNGIGIAQKDLPYIFDKFVQGDSSISRTYSGSGLGLALARELAELHGGSIAVQSREGVGSRFVVTLPIGNKDWSDLD